MTQRENIFFRASAIGKIMTGAKLPTPEARLTDLQQLAYHKLVEKLDANGGVLEDLTAAEQKKWKSFRDKVNAPNKLGGTAKTYIKELWLQNEYGFHEHFTSKEMKKGIHSEDLSLNLLSDVTDRTLFKNSVRNSARNITGEHDAEHGRTVIDIKSSWSPITFMKAKMTGIYEWQLRAYMFLIDASSAELAYCLVDCPPDVFRQLERKAMWDADIIDDAGDAGMEITAQLQRNFIYSNQERYADLTKRVKRYSITVDFKMEAMMHASISLALDYYESLTLNIIEDEQND